MNILGHCRFLIKHNNFKLDIEFNLFDTGIMGIYGPSGCGKSSLLRAMAGLDFHAGSAFILNQLELQNEQTFMPAQQRRVALVFQDLALFPHLNVEQNIRYAASRIANTATLNYQEIMNTLDIENLQDRMPHELSGGEQQRVAIARALMSSPQLLLLDESLNALDLKTKENVIKHLRKVHIEFNVPMVVVSHDIAVIVQLCDQLLSLDKTGYQQFDSVHHAMLEEALNPFTTQQLMAVLDAKITQVDSTHGSCMATTQQGTKFVLNGEYELNQSVRLNIPANQVSISLTEPQDSSVLNLMSSKITNITNLNKYESLIILQTTQDQLISLISKRSLTHLNLAINQNVFLQIKSHAIQVINF